MSLKQEKGFQSERFVESQLHKTPLVNKSALKRIFSKAWESGTHVGSIHNTAELMAWSYREGLRDKPVKRRAK